jgi:uncharacterized membrane protein YhhN
MLAFYALGDGLIELSMVAGALAFAAGHLVAIFIYFRHRRVKPVFSQKLLAVTILLATPVIAYSLPPTRDEGIQVAAYSIILAAMAAMAWSSRIRGDRPCHLVSLLFRRADDRCWYRANTGQTRPFRRWRRT